MSGRTPAEERAAAMVGRVLSDRYRLDELVAMGSMGAVYRGFHLKMRKEVAIKVLHPETEGFPDLVARFEREAVAGAHIAHPNVASASDMGQFDGGSYFLVQEYVHGRTLREILDHEGPMQPARAIHLIRQLAGALGAAHERGILHRDLKPRNIMVTDGDPEKLKLIDFGLAKVPLDKVAPIRGEPEKALSVPGVVFGTVDYMAPEIGFGMHAITERSDLYAVGIIFYELLAGTHPFDPGQPHEVLIQHRQRPPPPIRERNPRAHVPPALEGVVMRLLEKDSTRRYQSAAALIDALDAGSPPREEGSSPRAFETVADDAARVRRGVAALIVGGVVFVSAVILAVGVLRGRDSAGTTASPGADEPEPERSAAPARSAPGASTPLAEGLRRDLHATAKDGDVADAAAILTALADADKNALADAATRAAAKTVAIRAGEAGGDDATTIFHALAYRFGTVGLDILYEVANEPGHDKAARRAGAIVEIQATSERASPALRVAMQLRKVACKQKPLLFGRAASDGDARALAVLESLKPPACDPKGEACCFRRHAGLEKAVEAIRARTGK